MIGMMRPFYQAHWDISKDIKHVWLLICTYYIAWILGGEGRGENGDCSRSLVRTVSTGCETPQCAASWMLLLYAGDSSRWLLTPSPQFLSRGAQTFWHRARAYSSVNLLANWESSVNLLLTESWEVRHCHCLKAKRQFISVFSLLSPTSLRSLPVWAHLCKMTQSSITEALHSFPFVAYPAFHSHMLSNYQ